MSLQTTCSRFRAVETRPVLEFVCEDTLGLEASYFVAFTISKENACNWGMTYHTHAMNMVDLVCGREHKNEL